MATEMGVFLLRRRDPEQDSQRRRAAQAANRSDLGDDHSAVSRDIVDVRKPGRSVARVEREGEETTKPTMGDDASKIQERSRQNPIAIDNAYPAALLDHIEPTEGTARSRYGVNGVVQTRGDRFDGTERQTGTRRRGECECDDNRGGEGDPEL